MWRAWICSFVVVACGSPPPPATPPAAPPDAQPGPPKTDAECYDAPACITGGLCHAHGSTCVARSDDDCASSLDCGEDGECTFEDGACVATDADCRAHVGCQVDGRCTSVGGKCAAASDADCQRAEVCTELGRCAFHPATSGYIARCDAPTHP